MNRARTVGSKWIKTKVLLLNKELRKFVPETRIYSQTNLLHMLIKHKMVYVKPINGSFGQGVIRVEKNDKYRFQAGKVAKSFGTFQGLFAALNKAKLNRSYLVQQGIHLLNPSKADIRHTHYGAKKPEENLGGYWLYRSRRTPQKNSDKFS